VIGTRIYTTPSILTALPLIPADRMIGYMLKEWRLVMTALTRESIQALLASNDRAIGRALVVLFNNQTADEQISETVRVQNGKGFKGPHGKIGTSMAKFFLRNGYLSEKQIAYWRKPDRRGQMRIGCYWRQLIEAAENRVANK
jgi:hypothetical protein